MGQSVESWSDIERGVVAWMEQHPRKVRISEVYLGMSRQYSVTMRAVQHSLEQLVQQGRLQVDRTGSQRLFSIVQQEGVAQVAIPSVQQYASTDPPVQSDDGDGVVLARAGGRQND